MAQRKDINQKDSKSNKGSSFLEHLCFFCLAFAILVGVSMFKSLASFYIWNQIGLTMELLAGTVAKMLFLVNAKFILK